MRARSVAVLQQGVARQNAAGQKPLAHNLGQFGQQGVQQQSSMASLLPALAAQGAFPRVAGPLLEFCKPLHGACVLIVGFFKMLAGQPGNAQYGNQMLPQHLLQQQREQHQR